MAVSEVEEYLLNLCPKRYYEITDELFFNPLVKLLEINDESLFRLFNICFENNEIIASINKWLIRKNKERKEGPLGFFSTDLPLLNENSNIVEYFRENYSNIIDIMPIKKLSINQLKIFIYLYCEFENLYYVYCLNVVEKQNNLISNYSGLLKDNDFIKWHLIPLSANRVLEGNRIFDYDNNKTIHIFLKKDILSIFSDLIDKKMIGKISLRSNDIIENGIIEDNTLCEAVEKGNTFNLNINGLPNESKLYSEENYFDQMWVFKDGQDLTFEELLDDFECEDDLIVTQMVHLQYIIEDNIPYITHIDKENIYYSTEEYDCRIEKRIKGTARKRIKFFKINDSKIPFEYPCQIINTNFRQEHLETTEKSIPFIFYIVRYFFKNKKNVDEYFSNILD